MTDTPPGTNGFQLVSVIVPVFNRAARVAACVASVRAQTYRPIELIVVDDGSTDETLSVLFDLQKQMEVCEGLVFSVISQANAGAPSARNHGIRKCKGDWILFLDSDDLLLPAKIENAINSARQTRADIVYSKAQYIDQQGAHLPRFWGKPLKGDWGDRFEFSWQTMCAIYSRRAIKRIGNWNEGLIISQDWEFCIRAVTSGLAIHFDDRVDALYLSEGDDRIGSGINARKHQGRERALWAVFEHLTGMGLMCPPLKLRFRSRLLHVFLSYRALGENVFARDLVDKMAAKDIFGSAAMQFLRRVPNQRHALLIVQLFRRRVIARKTT